MKTVFSIALVIGLASVLWAGPYSLGIGGLGGSAVDEPIPGFTGPDGDGIVGGGYYDSDGNYVYDPELGGPNTVNPVFIGWATRVVDYLPANEAAIDAAWKNRQLALGPVTGDNFDIVSLGELSAQDVTAGVLPGRIILAFDVVIQNGTGPDFAVFENSFFGGNLFGEPEYAPYAGVFLELAYVEVSTDGVNFARFPCVSNNEQFDPANFPNNPRYEIARAYGNRDATNVYNLAGKHVNNGGESWGTPFDLSDLAAHPLVLSGVVDLNNIRYVQLVDIPGSGQYSDSNGHPIYDAWETSGSGGFDVEAVGVLNGYVPTYDTYAAWASAMIPDASLRAPLSDPDADGWPNLLEYACGTNPLVPNSEAATTPSLVDGRLQMTFFRQPTALDVAYSVWAFTDLTKTGTLLALTSNGRPLDPILPGVQVVETLLENGLIEVKLTDNTAPTAETPRFLRLNVSIP